MALIGGGGETSFLDLLTMPCKALHGFFGSAELFVLPCVAGVELGREAREIEVLADMETRSLV